MGIAHLTRETFLPKTNMSIDLTSDQEKFIQTQLESGKYETPPIEGETFVSEILQRFKLDY